MIKYVFLDLDDTILDFHKAEDVAIEKTLKAFSIPATAENKALYSKINKGCWEALERGEITRGALRLLRFERFFEAIGATEFPHAGGIILRLFLFLIRTTAFGHLEGGCGLTIRCNAGSRFRRRGSRDVSLRHRWFHMTL